MTTTYETHVYENFRDEVKRRDRGGQGQITLGEMLELANYRPEWVEEFAVRLIDEDECYCFILHQDDFDEFDEVWDGGLSWNESQRKFEYHGRTQPSGRGEEIQVDISTSSVFEICC